MQPFPHDAHPVDDPLGAKMKFVLQVVQTVDEVQAVQFWGHVMIVQVPLLS